MFSALIQLEREFNVHGCEVVSFRMMNQFELNQIRSKLRRLDLDDQFIERYLEKLIRNKEPFVTASKAIDRWEKKDSGQFVLQALACGFIAALAGGWFAVVQ